MKLFYFSLISICFYSCNYSAIKSQFFKRDVNVINPDAKRFCDSAIILAYDTMIPTIRNSPYTIQDTNKIYEKAIGFTNKAISLDNKSSYAYWIKLDIQVNFGRYNDALVTARQLNKLWPKNPDFAIAVGALYERNGDTITSKSYFKNALLLYNKVIDTISAKTKLQTHNWEEMNRAIDFIMLDQPVKGNSVLKELYNKQTDSLSQKRYLQYLGKTKKEILYSKAWY